MQTFSPQPDIEIETFCGIYDLSTSHSSGKVPFPHQTDALDRLRVWYIRNQGLAGGILALPTGGGKTFTAWRFICEKPLSEGYKVLWLAHTHHLLEQAYYSLQGEVGLIRNRDRLKVRVVSGTKGHFRPYDINLDDDVLICTLQTASRAHAKDQPHFQAFLRSAGDKLMVVFDEAHHAPAPGYRKLIQGLQAQCSDMKLLGLTATPTYHDETKRGWLKVLFPQEILYQVSVQDLIAHNILAKPIFEDVVTSFTPEFPTEEYKKWLRNYSDIGEKIITKLAKNQKRNALIADTYVKHKGMYGKTIIFTDRWFQCEALSTALKQAGIRVGSVYSHVDARIYDEEERRKQTADENRQIIEKFKNNELDVLINVRMLTEGTDIPDVKTVFLTRQTTSQILLTQMVGRALRGSKSCPGKDSAYIVSFIDNWRQEIAWAEFILEDGDTDDTETRKRARTALELISIELVRRLCEQINRGVNINEAEFLTYLPVGWYVVQYESLVDTQDQQSINDGAYDTEIVQRLIMVYGHEREAYENFIEHIGSEYVKSRSEWEQFADPTIKFEDHQPKLEEWKSCFFGDIETIGDALLTNLFHIVRDIATIDEHNPQFFEFEERDKHDLDAIARRHLNNKSEEEQYDLLEYEYEREDRFWKSFYFNYDLFWSHYTACKSWLLKQRKKGLEKLGKNGISVKSNDELSEEIKRQIKERDGNRCVCCGATKYLQIDHIKPKFFYGVDNSPENLQTLCKTCNIFKSDKYVIDFRHNKFRVTTPPTLLPEPNTLPRAAAPPERWEEYLRRVINFFYGCHAVKTIQIARGDKYRHVWEVTLYSIHNPDWINAHIEELIGRVQEYRDGRNLTPTALTIR